MFLTKFPSPTSVWTLLGLAMSAVALLGTTGCVGAPRTETGTPAPTTVPARSAPVPASSTPVPASSTPVPVPSAAPVTVSSTAASAASEPTVARQSATTTTEPRPTAAIDELVGPPGARVHVRCVGEGDPTVVLIAGFGGDLTDWSIVEPAIATRTRVCSYDRPGTGTSDPASATATFGTQASALHDLLASIGEPGPYVLVGHSFGGAEAVSFASRFPDDVTGLVLVDASPKGWPAALCAVPDDGSDGATMLRAFCSGAFLPTGNGEHLDVQAAFGELSGIGSLGALPMAVITATERTLPADLAAIERARLTEAWNLGQQGWAALSTAAHLVSVDDTGHHIEIEQPHVVIDEITRLLP